MEDIETFLPHPHGENGSEVLLWNALRIIGHKSFTPPNLELLKQACGLARIPDEMGRVSEAFRARLQEVLGILGHCAQGEGEGHRLGRDLVALLQGST